MLTNLEEVSWERLSHAFGEASDVPTLLKAIELGGETATAAVNDLFNTIWHQGTVYEASAPAVPFLGELASSAELDVQDRVLLMSLVFAIGRGKGYWQVHASGSALPVPSDLDEQLRREERCVTSCRVAVQEQAARFLSQLDEHHSPTLWITASTCLVVAGLHQRSYLPLPPPPPGVGTFARTGLRLIEYLVTSGSATEPMVRRVAELDEDLAQFVADSDADLEGIDLDSDFLDLLVERISDVTWQEEGR